MVMSAPKQNLFAKGLLAVFLPPAAAFWEVRLGVHFWINLALTLVAWLPGVIHALWLVLSDGHLSLTDGRP
jgi:uncharacterized membrane protein YqaE (UPF0057 family)